MITSMVENLDNTLIFTKHFLGPLPTTGHGTTDWFQIGKGVRQVRILSPCLFNLYAEYIMRNAGLEEARAGIKIEEESEKVGLKLSIQKTKIMASGPITSWQIDRETVETVADFICLQNHYGF